MEEYILNRKETETLRKIRRILDDTPGLAEEFLKEGIHPQRMWDPQDTYYILDQIPSRAASNMSADQQIRQILGKHRTDFHQVEGNMLTQATEEWERYPLESLFRLLWRMRETDCEVRFMRGGATKNKPLILWRAEIFTEQGNRVLRCFDEHRHNFMYMTLTAPNFTMQRQYFLDEMRSFLHFEEGTIWISNGATFGILEVSE